MKKYEFTGETKEIDGHIFHKIKSVRKFRVKIFRYNTSEFFSYTVEPNEPGGWIENESNLSHSGRCWVFPDSFIEGSRIDGDAVIGHYSYIKNSFILDNSTISGTSKHVVFVENSMIFGRSVIYCNQILNSIIKNLDINNGCINYKDSIIINNGGITIINDIGKIILWKNGLWKRSMNLLEKL